jgi:hypothetical protein
LDTDYSGFLTFYTQDDMNPTEGPTGDLYIEIETADVDDTLPVVGDPTPVLALISYLDDDYWKTNGATGENTFEVSQFLLELVDPCLTT